MFAVVVLLLNREFYKHYYVHNIVVAVVVGDVVAVVRTFAVGVDLFDIVVVAVVVIADVARVPFYVCHDY